MSYMYGYSNPPARRSLVELDRIAQWNRMDPEFRRRLIAMFDASNLTVGFGGGWRSSAQQRALFLSRYHVSASGSIFWEGKRWAKNSGVATAAPPGRSYHEETTPDGMALAADLVGDLKFVHAHGGEFGLHDFGNVNNEPWHVQPNEIPNGRTGYRSTSMHPLPVWPLNVPPPPPSPGVIRAGERGIDFSYARPPIEVIKANGFTFLIRYLSVWPADVRKNMTRTEAAGYLAAGLKILDVWEVKAADPNEGRPLGLLHGRDARRCVDDVGHPHHVPLLVAVDLPSTAANIDQHEGYLRGFSTEYGRPIGGYGGTRILERVKDICQILWVSNAWSWSGSSRADMEAKARALGAHVIQGSQYNLDGKYAVDPNDVIRDIPAWDAQHVPPTPEKPPTLPKPQLPPIPEGDEDMPTNLHVTAEGRGEIHITLDGSGATLLGYSSPADRDNINAATGARACPVTAEQFDVIVALARQGDGN